MMVRIIRMKTTTAIPVALVLGVLVSETLRAENYVEVTPGTSQKVTVPIPKHTRVLNPRPGDRRYIPLKLTGARVRDRETRRIIPAGFQMAVAGQWSLRVLADERFQGQAYTLELTYAFKTSVFTTTGVVRRVRTWVNRGVQSKTFSFPLVVDVIFPEVLLVGKGSAAEVDLPVRGLGWELEASRSGAAVFGAVLSDRFTVEGREVGSDRFQLEYEIGGKKMRQRGIVKVLETNPRYELRVPAGRAFRIAPSAVEEALGLTGGAFGRIVDQCGGNASVVLHGGAPDSRVHRHFANNRAFAPRAFEAQPDLEVSAFEPGSSSAVATFTARTRGSEERLCQMNLLLRIEVE